MPPPTESSKSEDDEALWAAEQAAEEERRRLERIEELEAQAEQVGCRFTWLVALPLHSCPWHDALRLVGWLVG